MAGPGSQSREQTTSQPAPACLDCHSNPDLSITFPSGERLPLFVDTEAFEESVHGGRLSCDACHPAQTRYPHSPLQVANHRDYILGYYQVCGRCHFENYAKTLDSVHYAVLTEGRKEAPTCADCHSSHDVTSPDEPRSRIPERCGTCHEDVYDEYARSVHGAALLEEGNRDVPVCTDCHGVHEIRSPEKPAFRLGSVDVCAQCHGDKERMEKYGISTNVLKSYLDDFHGKTFTFYKGQSTQVWPETPVCTDCHGVHDIVSVDSPDSPVLKENLLPTCRRCHADAGPNFPSAWLSHYEPSVSRAPLVFGVRWFYRFLIPFIIGGLMLHIALDVWRLARNR
jgi:predicted CXXCH cytochrome family protein